MRLSLLQSINAVEENGEKKEGRGGHNHWRADCRRTGEESRRHPSHMQEREAPIFPLYTAGCREHRSFLDSCWLAHVSSSWLMYQSSPSHKEYL